MARAGVSSGLVSAFPPQSHVEHSGAPSPPSPRCIVYTVLVRVGSVDLEFSCNVNFQHQFDYFITLNCRYHAAWMYKVFTACKMHSKILYKFAHFEITRFQKNLKNSNCFGPKHTQSFLGSCPFFLFLIPYYFLSSRGDKPLTPSSHAPAPADKAAARHLDVSYCTLW